MKVKILVKEKTNKDQRASQNTDILFYCADFLMSLLFAIIVDKQHENNDTKMVCVKYAGHHRFSLKRVLSMR